MFVDYKVNQLQTICQSHNISIEKTQNYEGCKTFRVGNHVIKVATAKKLDNDSIVVSLSSDVNFLFLETAGVHYFIHLEFDKAYGPSYVKIPLTNIKKYTITPTNSFESIIVKLNSDNPIKFEWFIEKYKVDAQDIESKSGMFESPVNTIRDRINKSVEKHKLSSRSTNNKNKEYILSYMDTDLLCIRVCSVAKVNKNNNVNIDIQDKVYPDLVIVAYDSKYIIPMFADKFTKKTEKSLIISEEDLLRYKCNHPGGIDYLINSAIEKRLNRMKSVIENKSEEVAEETTKTKDDSTTWVEPNEQSGSISFVEFIKVKVHTPNVKIKINDSGIVYLYNEDSKRSIKITDDSITGFFLGC